MPKIEIYTSLEETPDDTDIKEDGLDVLDILEKVTIDQPTPVVRKIVRRVIPLRRTLKIGMQGKDVRAVQRALVKAKFRKEQANGIYDTATRQQVRMFQMVCGIKEDGIYGPVTHKHLAPFFDDYGMWLMLHVNLERRERSAIVATALFGYSKRDKIHYTQSPKRMQGVREKIRPPKVPSWEDCSSFATWCYWVGTEGKLDPNGRNFDGFGYTGTLSKNGKPTENPKIGDLGFYGTGTYDHVVIYIGNNRCVSHGSEKGPYLLNPYYRSDFSHWRTYFKNVH